MRKIFTVTRVFALAIAFSSCATRKVSRVNTNEVIDLSGRWNDTDSQLVSAEMIGDLLGARWLPVYESQHNNKRPVVVVGRQLQKRTGCLLSGRSGTDQPGNERSGLDGR